MSFRVHPHIKRKKPRRVRGFFVSRKCTKSKTVTVKVKVKVK